MIRCVQPEVPKRKFDELKIMEPGGRKSFPKFLARVPCRVPPPFDEDLRNPVLPGHYRQESPILHESSAQTRQCLGKISFRQVLEHRSADNQVIVAPRWRELPKCQNIGLLKTNQGNASRVQLHLELLQHRGREIKCVDDLRLYAPLAERVQKGKGCCTEPGTGVEDAKPRTEKLGPLQQCSYPVPGAKKGDESSVRIQSCRVELFGFSCRIRLGHFCSDANSTHRDSTVPTAGQIGSGDNFRVADNTGVAEQVA
jgi:hypothetical protein